MAGMMRRGLDVLREGAPGVFLMALVACTGEPPEPDAGVDGNGGALRVGDALGVEDVEGFRRADGPRAFEFPRDHGPHPGFRNEWWYLTGNLDDPDGGRHGFHITFFRVALAPELEGDPAFHGSSWATPRLWMAHAAILDVEGDWHGSEERFARDAAGLAGASEPAGRVWLEDWELAGLAGDTWDLRFTVDGRELELELDPERAPVLQGEAGLSQKGPEPGNASYYYSVPRIAARGTLRDANDDERLLSGQAWLDREWSSGALAAGQIGWNWFALQFDDGTDLMYYQLRREDGAPHERSKGRWMPADAPDHELRPEHVELEPLRHARMPSGNRYPVVWAMTVTLPDGNSPRRFRVEAVREFQEMDTVIPYWEGAVDIRDEEGELLGRGFVELTGYEREDEE
ncbi:lipocalin-like domain-containing protein [Thioalkalivibrio sp. AKL17]|uniref:lipocalin-like domain-containing protein n=1 Tax=Thioalkalivibrio sp. AKL17 TaxID=1158160 RepID=UPI0003646FD6|nr:lipocalin-like domain-containing protein [Thioalkalivibrio sp. AKL17]